VSAYSVSDGATTLTVTTDPGTHGIRLDIDVDETAMACLSLSGERAAEFADALDLCVFGAGT